MTGKRATARLERVLNVTSVQEALDLLASHYRMAQHLGTADLGIRPVGRTTPRDGHYRRTASSVGRRGPRGTANRASPADQAGREAKAPREACRGTSQAVRADPSRCGTGTPTVRTNHDSGNDRRQGGRQAGREAGVAGTRASLRRAGASGLQRHAPLQERVLEEFQKEGWLPSIPNPLKGGAKQLRDVLYQLNHRQRPWRIRFDTTPDGKGVCWSVRA